ncbi:hypothetical protein D3C85_1449080 [compost metagenome]
MPVDPDSDTRPVFVNFDMNITASQMVCILNNPVNKIGIGIENQLLFLIGSPEEFPQ